MTAVVALRFAKLLAVLLFAGGTAGAFLARDLEDRRRAAFLLAGPGFVLSWMLGYALAIAAERSIASAWIAGAAITSTMAINLVLWSVGADGRRGWLAGLGSLAMLVATVALMVFRPEVGP